MDWIIGDNMEGLTFRLESARERLFTALSALNQTVRRNEPPASDVIPAHEALILSGLERLSDHVETISTRLAREQPTASRGPDGSVNTREWVEIPFTD